MYLQITCDSAKNNKSTRYTYINLTKLRFNFSRKVHLKRMPSATEHSVMTLTADRNRTDSILPHFLNTLYSFCRKNKCKYCQTTNLAREACKTMLTTVDKSLCGIQRIQNRQYLFSVRCWQIPHEHCSRVALGTRR